MKTLSELNYLLDFYNIDLCIVPLDDSIRGYYYHDQDGSFILINTRIKDTYTYRCVLAEEIGHHLTTVGDILPYGYPSSSNSSSNVNRQELKAMRWATDFLMPTNEVISFISSQINPSIESITAHFEIINSFAIEKFYFMAKEKLSWRLDDHRCLILSSLPSIYITNMF